METVVLEINEVPSSSNHGGGGSRRHWAVGAREKAKFEGLFLVALLAAKVPKKLESVRAFAELQFKDKRRRDPDNFHFPISKPLGDSLVKGGYIPDDDPDHYSFQGVRLHPEPLKTLLRQKARMFITLDFRVAALRLAAPTRQEVARERTRALQPPGEFGATCD